MKHLVTHRFPCLFPPLRAGALVALGARVGLSLTLGLGLGPSGSAFANEVVMPSSPGAGSAGRDGASGSAADREPMPDISALAGALADVSTRGSMLQQLTSSGGGGGGVYRVVLRPEALIDRPLIQLGDVFGGLPDEIARIPVARAPEPGDRLLLDPDYLSGLATQYGVDWTPASRFVQAIVTRRGYEVGRAQVLDALRDSLLEQGMPPEAEVEISVFNAQTLVGSPDDARVAVRDVRYDDRTGRFNALVQIPAEGQRSRSVRLTGSVHVSIDVPVLIRPIRRDMIITANDLGWDAMRRGDLRPDILVDPSDLIGRAARYGIQAGRPVRANQVSLPELVPRNGLVTMVLETPFMTVTARGRALEAGAEGETVRVANQSSGKEVLAVVTGRNTVKVEMGMMTAASR